MSSTEPECTAEAEEECTTGRRESVPTPLRAEDDKIASQMYSVNEELVAYTFQLLEQCVTLTDAVTEINQVNLVYALGNSH